MRVQRIAERIIRVEDVHDFNLLKTMRSGQSFRWMVSDGLVYCITGNNVVRLKQKQDGSLVVAASEKEWEKVWRPYFDLDHDYSQGTFTDVDRTEVEKRICNVGHGIHILKQDPWEVLASFIITQNCHVSRARKIVGELCNRYGTEITNTDLGVKFKTFPSPAEILKHESDIARMGIGYRDYYLMSAAECVDSGIVPLRSLHLCNDTRLKQVLERIVGVGPMISNSVALFAYQRRSAVPIDMWVEYALIYLLGGGISLRKYGDLAGLMQQYIYYYVREGAYLPENR